MLTHEWIVDVGFDDIGGGAEVVAVRVGADDDEYCRCRSARDGSQRKNDVTTLSTMRSYFVAPVVKSSRV